MSLSISGSSGFLQAQQAMFAKLDLNTDGALSADEFTAIGQNMPPQEGARQLKGGGGFQGFSAETLSALMGVQQTSHADRAAEIFAGADADGDGRPCPTGRCGNRQRFPRRRYAQRRRHRR